MFSLSQRGSPNRMIALNAHLLGLLSCGVFSVCFGQTPVNDNFTNAIVLHGNTSTFSGSLTNATYESGESPIGCGGNNFAGGSVWWSWTATNSIPVVIDVLASTGYPNTGLSVFTGKDVTVVTEVDCIVLDSLTNRYLHFVASAGTTYHIRAWGLPNAFTFRLTATNPPVIFTQPQSQTVPESASVMFGVIAGGVPPLNYQWQFAGNALAGRTVPTLVLHYLAASQAGAYSVVVSNASGVATSTAAILTLSPTSPPFVLATTNSPDTNRLLFSLAGDIGRTYRVWATTNLIDWTDEESLAPEPGRPALVVNSNATSVYSIPIEYNQKFLRASHFMNTEICIAQLKAIKHAIRFWAIESRHSIAAVVTEQNILPYLQNPVVCPSGGTSFANSYTITDASDLPYCRRVPESHQLPP
jgi:hypothetical protein